MGVSCDLFAIQTINLKFWKWLLNYKKKQSLIQGLAELAGSSAPGIFRGLVVQGLIVLYFKVQMTKVFDKTGFTCFTVK